MDGGSSQLLNEDEFSFILIVYVLNKFFKLKLDFLNVYLNTSAIECFKKLSNKK